MGERARGSAVAEMAADLAEQGRGVALTVGGGENPGGEGQADLFRALDEEVEAHAAATIAPPKRGPGRPAGSPNRTTLQLQRYLQARGYRDPAEFLASLVSMDTRELAAALRGLPAAAVGFDEAAAVLEIQRKAAGELMPYFHSKMPLAIHHQGEAARPLIIINEQPAGGVVRLGEAGAMSAMEEIAVEAVRLSDQRLGGVAAQPAGASSHGAASHDVPQVFEATREKGAKAHD